jgi:saccharopine dehydrogenase-like NADP-dependent oxidoreductase
MVRGVKKAVVLGAGMVGSTMALDLNQDPDLDVRVVDARPQALERLSRDHGLATQEADLASAPALSAAVADADIVLGALSSAIGFQSLKTIIEAGKDVVDISFMAEDALELSALAEQSGVCAVVDCGVSPGLGNLFAGRATALLDTCESLAIYVGGLPVERHWPYEFKAAYAPADVFEIYTRPARLVEGGKVVIKEALSESELISVPGIGTLEAFNTDGLRSLISTLNVPNMKEKTLRYPGHIDIMAVLRDTGLFSTEKVVVNGQEVSPRELTAAVLIPHWTYGEDEADLTVLRVQAQGLRGDETIELTWDVVDRFDPVTRTRSMSRTTAYPATIVARLLLEGRFAQKGVFPPEVVGQDSVLFDDIMNALESRGVHHTFSERVVGAKSA